MPKLRMKDSHATDEAVLKATRRAAKRAKREAKRKATSTETVEEPITPPRSARARHGSHGDAHPLEGHDWGFDESSAPPEQAYKKARRLDSDEDEAAFAEKLKDANAQDAGVGFYEDILYERQPAEAFSYDSAAARAMGVQKNWGAMDDEEYAEYMRAGMWRLKNREELERRERAEKERAERLKREEEELARLRREEARRIRKLEENAKRRNAEFEKSERSKYQEKWNALTDSLKTDKALRFTDFPWPLLPPAALPPLSWPEVDEITSGKIESFLFPSSDSFDDDDKRRKQNLRTAILAYHPDRFERYILKIPEDKTDVRERVRAIALRVSQVLNDIAKH